MVWCHLLWDLINTAVYPGCGGANIKLSGISVILQHPIKLRLPYYTNRLLPTTVVVLTSEIRDASKRVCKINDANWRDVERQRTNATTDTAIRRKQDETGYDSYCWDSGNKAYWHDGHNVPQFTAVLATMAQNETEISVQTLNKSEKVTFLVQWNHLKLNFLQLTHNADDLPVYSHTLLPTNF